MPGDLDEIKGMLKKVLENQERILAGERDIERQEGEIEHQEERELADSREELSELERLETLEKNIEKDISTSPLTRITKKDFARATVGAFFGVVGHFAFFYGTEIAHFEHFTTTRAILLYVVSFMLAILFMYFSGFREVSRDAMKYMPLRVLVIYATSIAVILFVLYIFGFVTAHNTFIDIFKTVSTVSVLAVLGASAADLLGKKE